MLSELSQIQKDIYHIISHTESEKREKNNKTHSNRIEWWLSECEGKERYWSKDTNFSYKMKKFWRPNVRMVNIVNNSVLYTWNLLRIVDLKSSYHTPKKLIMRSDGYVNSFVVIILQCMHISKYHTACLKYIHFYLSK